MEINLKKILDKELKKQEEIDWMDMEETILSAMKIACEKTIDLCAKNCYFEVECQTSIIELETLLKLKKSIK